LAAVSFRQANGSHPDEKLAQEVREPHARFATAHPVDPLAKDRSIYQGISPKNVAETWKSRIESS
jgi:hypothetical protein